MHHFFAYLSKMKHIKRWGLMRNIETENIKEHSFDVAVIAHALASIENEYFGGKIDEAAVCLAALFHEAGEIITGDLPTPIKNFSPKIREAYGEVEDIALEKILSMLPPELKIKYAPHIRHEGKTEYRFVKAADKLAAYIKCVEELKGGNTEFEKAKLRIEEELRENKLPSVSYFMDNFLPSYFLTLDELN